MSTRTLTLADGRSVSYTWRRSLRARHVGLRLSRHAGLQVTVPRGVTLERVDGVVRAKGEWIVKHLERFAALPPPPPPVAVPLPQAIELPALGECWRVTYQGEERGGILLRQVAGGELLLRGDVADEGLCRTALRRWLAERAEVALLPWLYRLAGAGGFRYRRAQIRGQRSRWGSCSARGTISLNWHLLFLAPQEVDYVLLHELCHTVELNHSPRFWSLLQQHQPDSAALKIALRRAWQGLPPWLNETQQPQRVD